MTTHLQVQEALESISRIRFLYRKAICRSAGSLRVGVSQGQGPVSVVGWPRLHVAQLSHSGQALNGRFAGFVAAESEEINAVLLNAISHVANTGCMSYKWSCFVEVLVARLRAVLETAAEEVRAGGGGFPGDLTYDDSCNRLCELLASFRGPPFTLQRLCELLSTPHKHHRNQRKLMGAIDKLLSVTTIIPELPRGAVDPNEVLVVGERKPIKMESHGTGENDAAADDRDSQMHDVPAGSGGHEAREPSESAGDRVGGAKEGIVAGASDLAGVSGRMSPATANGAEKMEVDGEGGAVPVQG